MKLVTFNPTTIQEIGFTPVINIEFSDIENRTLGQEMVEVNVVRNGEYVRFWLYVGVNNQNRVTAEVATNSGSKTVRKKIVAGAWRLFGKH